MPIQIRNYRASDLGLIVVLINAAQSVDHDEQGTSPAELRDEMNMPDFKPEENAFVAQDDEGRIVAYAGLRLFRSPSESGFRTWFNVHPMFRGRGLEDRVLARLEERARERMGEFDAARVYLACSANTAYEERLRAIERAGMKEIRRFWVMLRANLESLPMPRWGPGFLVRTYRLGEDDREAVDALNDSFSEHFGHTDETLESFQYYLSLKMYRPDLTVLAMDPLTNRIAGFCHIVVNEGECQRLGRLRGWIDILGVRKQYRHQGLGEALILQGMHNLRAAGMSEVVLACDSLNTTNATRLYFRVGFEVWRETIVFEKYLREGWPQAETERALAEL